MNLNLNLKGNQNFNVNLKLNKNLNWGSAQYSTSENLQTENHQLKITKGKSLNDTTYQLKLIN